MAIRPSLAVVVTAAALLMSGCGGAEDEAEPQPSASASDAHSTDATMSGAAAVETSEDVDIGGRSLYVRCWGEQRPAEPTVVLIGGGGDIPTGTWLPMAENLAAEGHLACAYDRAGIGRSDPPPEPRRTLKDQAADLEALLDAIELSEPVVLVAHSAGAQVAVGLVDRAPQRVAGVVLVDPQCPRVDDIMSEILPPEKPNESAELAAEREHLTSFRIDPSQEVEHLHLAASDRTAIALLDRPGPFFGDLPVVVLQAPHVLPPGLPAHYLAALDAALEEGKAEFAAESRRGELITVQDSSHFIHEDRPEVVIDAILDVLAG